ncbi:MAG TPA: xanthine dehydrogenase family protein molybdopterin-binding subunit [Gaiellaceae bacterium]|nr:xanthine dehydrogenase family protein molybdopterin-binding subunit [Gaiellaceae bacterium]
MRVSGAGAVGRALPRREDARLLTGLGEFVDDLAPEGVLEAAFLRSPFAHARIASIDTARATAAPGVVAVYTAEDLALRALVTPCEVPGSYSPPRPMLAEGVVRFVGEAVAVVVAESRYLAEDAVELIELELDPLEPVPDVGRALADAAPPVHEGRSNVYMETRLEAGEVDAAFARAATVVERTFTHRRVSAAPIEPRGALAQPVDGGARLWSSTQGPHKLRLAAAEVLGLDPARLQVVTPDVGGGFGQKAHVYPEEIVVAAAALRLDRPVRWTEDRVENLVGASHAREQRVRVRAAADADGRLLALDVEQTVDQGAYGLHPHGPTLEAHTASGLMPGPYRLGAYRLHNRAVATTKCPMGAYRGVGFVIAAWIHERLMDVLAAELALDRAEIRRRNLIRPDEFPYATLTRQQYDSGDYARALELALGAVGYDGFEDERAAARRDGRLLGLGVGCYVEPTGMNSRVFEARGMTGVEGFDGAHVALEPDGTAVVWTTTPAIGQGTETTFAQLVADAVGLDVEAVTVARSDTSVGELKGTGSFASRSAVSAGGAAVEAGTEVRRRLLEDAAERLEAAFDDLELIDGVVRVAGSPGASIPIRDLLAAAPPDRYRVSAHWDPPSVAYPYATHACVVEVDPETGQVTIRRYVVAEDCGRVINPAVVEGQIHGATAQGIAEALYEQIVYDDEAQMQTASFMDYLVPTAGELPTLEIEHLETPSPTSAGGVKGVGEGGTVGAPGAVANAVCDAVGLELNELPITPERVRAALAAGFRS